MERVLDIVVPFGPFLRRAESSQPFLHWADLVLHVIPLTFFFYWLCSLIPFVGTLFYLLVLVPLSANRHVKLKATCQRIEKFSIYLWYYVVISIGFSGLWGFIGHTVMADTVAAGIGWSKGSPFQTELAFYTLGSSIAGLMAIWLRGHMITALVVTKSVFLYGAALVHIQDALVNKNYEPLNIGAPLVGDLILPTLFLVLLIPVLRNELKDGTSEITDAR